jgi:hypothetical protein
MSLFGQTENEKFQFSQELIRLEDTKDSVPPVSLVRETKNLLSQVRALPRWQDSRSGISASFQTLIRDQEFKAYLTSSDILARANALLAWAATRLTPEQAQAEGVAGLQRTSAAAAEEHLEVTQRLSQPGGEAWEVARETPDPFIDESIRRGAQVKEVGSKIIDKAAPIGQRGIDRLDEANLTNPILGILALAMLVFMKNKLLAIVIIVFLIYLTKQRQIAAVKARVDAVTDRVSSVTG